MKLSRERLSNYLKVAAFILLLIFIQLKYTKQQPPQTYAGGQKKSVGLYENGRPEGVWTWWFESGKKMMEGVFIEGKRNGIWNTWYHNGQIKSKGLYSNDMLNGTFSSWYSNGNIKNYGNYIDDKLHGLQQLYDLQGVLIEEKMFVKGEEIEHTKNNNF